eukprot:TRINITY_DN16342_c0_g1_i1.p1 TRINITY_DN16342_c0_g1~~TRINITY_DN16342_c0_g1_i1.p1  ORF type:complete len:536 (+),score=83.10 TRINITY_DN16342_c0_g1_i1:84-1691(+)
MPPADSGQGWVHYAPRAAAAAVGCLAAGLGYGGYRLHRSCPSCLTSVNGTARRTLKANLSLISPPALQAAADAIQPVFNGSWTAGKMCNCTAAMTLGTSKEYEGGPIPPADPGCRCRHEARLLAAGQQLRRQGEALDRQRAAVTADPSQHYVVFPVMGGFNNQRQCVVNSVIALAQFPNVTAVLPPSAPLMYAHAERWPHDYLPPYNVRTNRWMPWGNRAGFPGHERTGYFETLWDPDAWHRGLAAAGVRTAAAAPASLGPLRQLARVEAITGCDYILIMQNATCTALKKAPWGPFRATVNAWRQTLAQSPPAAWAADALCYQVAPMAGTDESCEQEWKKPLCDAALSTMRPNIVATTAAEMVAEALAGAGEWASAHFQEDWKCTYLKSYFLSAMAKHLRNGSLLFVTGSEGAPHDIAAAFAELGVRTLTKSDVLPELPRRLPYEVVGQIDWLVAASAPGPFFHMEYPILSSFDVYVQQARRRQGLPNIQVPVGPHCRLLATLGFVPNASEPRQYKAKGPMKAVPRRHGRARHRR